MTLTEFKIDFLLAPNVSVVGFEQVNVCWYEEQKLKVSLKALYKQEQYNERKYKISKKILKR